MKTDTERLWRRYAATRDQSARAELVEMHVPLVKRIARGLKKRLPVRVEVADLTSAGFVGLMQAVDAYDPGRGTKFTTFCQEKIRGAMLDDQRRMDWVPRNIRTKAHMIENARDALAFELQREPTDAEVARFLGVSARKLQGLLKEVDVRQVLSIEAHRPEDGTTRYVDIVADRSAVSPLERMATEDTRAELEALKGLNDTERAVLIGYHFDGKNLREIGEELGVSESRVSQVRTQALAYLRGRLG